jgi:hypothetical protein
MWFALSFAAVLGSTPTAWAQAGSPRLSLTLGPANRLEMIVHGGDTNTAYDLFFTPTLFSPPDGGPVTNRPPWLWLQRTAPGQTAWTVVQTPRVQGFFLLATTNDVDGDGLSDAYEALVCASDCDGLDRDQDGLPDPWEARWGLSVFVNDASADPDGDGLTNWDEWRYGLNPSLDDARWPGVSDEFRYDVTGRLTDLLGPGRRHWFYDAEGNLTLIFSD